MLVTAQVCAVPTDNWVTPDDSPVTATGLQLSVLEPRPSTPDTPSPQHCTPPPDERTQLCWIPEPMATTSERPDTVTGMLEFDIAASFPSCSSMSRPQHRTVPLGRTTQVCLSSAPIAPNVEANAYVGFASLISADARPRISTPAINKHATSDKRVAKRENCSIHL